MKFFGVMGEGAGLLISAWMEVCRRLPFKSRRWRFVYCRSIFIASGLCRKARPRSGGGGIEPPLGYFHYNSVKHGLVKRVSEWPWSSFHRYVKMGYYPSDWGGGFENEKTEIRRVKSIKKWSQHSLLTLQNEGDTPLRAMAREPLTDRIRYDRLAAIFSWLTFQ